MQPSRNARRSLSSGAVVALSLMSTPLSAQWTRIPQAGIPRTTNGQPDLSAPAPRSTDGRPDLSGIWEPDGAKYVRNLAADLKPEDVPFQPWARTLFDSR